MKPILYSYFRSSSSYRVRIALHLKNIDFEYSPVHLIKDGGQQNSLNFQAVNPFSQVPVLVDGVTILTQSLVIIEYIDNKWKSPSLFPSDSNKKFEILEMCELINSGIQPLQNLKVLQKIEKDFNVNQKQKEDWAQHFIHEGFKVIEKKLAKTSGLYSYGDAVCAFDCFLAPQAFSAQRFGVDLSLYPFIKKINDNLNKLSAFQKSHPQNQPDTPIEN